MPEKKIAWSRVTYKLAVMKGGNAWKDTVVYDGHVAVFLFLFPMATSCQACDKAELSASHAPITRR